MNVCPNEDCPGRGETAEPVEYVDTVEICADCGTPLVVPADYHPEETQGDYVPRELTRYFGPEEARLAADRLEAEGIEVLVDDRSFSVLPVLSSNRPQVRLLVAEDDLERSRNCLSLDHRAELDGTPEAALPPAADDRCPRCGNEHLLLRRFLLPWSSRIVTASTFVIIAGLSYFLGIGLLGIAVVLYLINIGLGATLECRRCGHRWRRRKKAT